MEWMIALCVLIAIGIVALLFAVISDEVRRHRQVNEDKAKELATAVCKPQYLGSVKVDDDELKSMLLAVLGDKAEEDREKNIKAQPTQWWYDRAWAIEELKKGNAVVELITIQGYAYFSNDEISRKMGIKRLFVRNLHKTNGQVVDEEVSFDCLPNGIYVEWTPSLEDDIARVLAS